MDERYVIGKDFNTKDWWVFDNERGLRVHYFNTEEEAKAWVEKENDFDEFMFRANRLATPVYTKGMDY